MACNHFPDIRKMVWHRMTRHVTGSFGPAYDVQKVFPFGIAQEVLNVASQPKFNTVVGPLRVGFKGAGERVNKFGFHRHSECAGW